jgi:hypothetical protein
LDSSSFSFHLPLAYFIVYSNHCSFYQCLYHHWQSAQLLGCLPLAWLDYSYPSCSCSLERISCTLHCFCRIAFMRGSFINTWQYSYSQHGFQFHTGCLEESELWYNDRFCFCCVGAIKII